MDRLRRRSPRAERFPGAGTIVAALRQRQPASTSDADGTLHQCRLQRLLARRHPLPPHTAAVLDWVLPGQQGDDAPLSAVARREALQRLQFLGERVPDTQSSRSGKVQGGRHRVRVAHGLVLNDYVGASLRFTSRASLAEPLTGWLALVERLPAGTEGSPVPRVLVRNLLVEPIPARATGNMGQLWRPMNVPPGAQPDRLGVVGWVSDARGRVLAVAQSRCAPSAPDTPP
ncbi:hypothetical protein [Ottowia sp. VDI28]|uniref:hypothetical protein n=1 Tax=Ottowia sp. VDI28 TaxID=3133968 RepID=UPI003C2C10A9